MNLSKRLEMVASLVPAGSSVFDCGCDHGFVSVRLIQNGTAKHATAADISEGPLSAARRNVEAYGLCDKIDLLLSDGIEKCVPEKEDTLIIAGMGGPLMLDIIGKDIIKTMSFKNFIFQPQSAVEDFRREIRLMGLHIAAEKDIYDGGKYYVAVYAIWNDEDNESCGNKESHTDKDSHGDIENPVILRLYDRYGKYLLERSDKALKRHILSEKRLCEDISKELSDAGKDRDDSRMREVTENLKDIAMTLNTFYLQE